MEADATALPTSLHGRFDLAYAMGEVVSAAVGAGLRVTGQPLPVLFTLLPSHAGG